MRDAGEKWTKSSLWAITNHDKMLGCAKNPLFKPFRKRQKEFLSI